MATGQDPFLIRQFSRHLSKSSSCSVGDDYSFQDELEFLQNVYYDDLKVTNQGEPNCTLLFHVTPSTADDKDKQFVYVEATITVDRKYPKTKPMIELNKSRGLVDSHLSSICLGVSQMVTERLGTPVIYDLIEYIRDCLTNNNRPYGMCVLCQFEFQDCDQFIRTQCYHYFHPECLVDYIHYCETTMEEVFDPTIMKPKLTLKKLECPVCRVELNKKLLNFSEADIVDIKEQVTDNFFQPSESLLAWQKEMAVLYKKQQDKGGIITDTDDDVIDNDTWVSTRGELQGNGDQQQHQHQQQEASSSSQEVPPRGESDIKSVKEDVPPSTKCLNQHKNHHGNRSHGNRSSHSSEYTKQTQKDKGKFEDNRTRKPDKRNEVVVIVQDRVHKRDNTNGTGQYRRHHHHRQPRNNSRLSSGRNKDTTKPTKNLSEKKVKSIETHSTAPIEIQLTTKQSS